MKKVLVVGGAGFIGRHLTSVLTAAGREVIVAGRRPSCDALPPGAIYCSVRNEDYSAVRNLGPFKEIVDLAYTSVPQTSFEDPVKDICENLPRFVQLLQFAVSELCERFVFLSSGGTVYGQAKALPVTESHSLNPVSPYGITKLTTEKYAAMFHGQFGLPGICLRPGNVYGSGQLPFKGQGFIATAVGAALTGKQLALFGHSGAVRDYIHVKDVALAIFAAMDRGVSGKAYNIGTGVGLNNLDILNSLEKVLPEGISLPEIEHLPERAFDVRENVLCSDMLREDTGWTPTIHLVEGLREYISWLTASGI